MSLDAITRVTQSCDPNTALEADDKRYISLAAARGESMAEEGGWRKQVIRNILRAATATTQLISGFTGDGKTTELKQMVQELETGDRKMAVVYVDCGDYLNAFHYSFSEVLFAVIAETGRQLREAPYGIELRPGYWTRKLDELKSQLLSEVELRELSGELAHLPFKVAAKIGLKARTEDTTRAKLWDLLRGDRATLVAEFGRTINEQVRPELRKKGFTDLVIVIDWLEKLTCQQGTGGGPNSHEELFLHQATLFQSFGAHVVLTLPIDMVYSAVQERLTMAYGSQPIVVSGVRVVNHFSPDERETALRAMRQLLANRFVYAPEGAVGFQEVFPLSDEQLPDDLIRFSGGHPRQLLVLIRQCCSFLDALPITRAAFEAAKKKEVLASGTKVNEAWFPKLAAVHRTHAIENDPVHLEMLRNLCVFGYANGEPSYAVDPAILPLSKMKRALEEYDRQRATPATG